jgi:hypothetical protein
MLRLLQFLTSYFARVEPWLEYEEAYLARSSDIYDLERRMRALDDLGRGPLTSITTGLFTR